MAEITARALIALIRDLDLSGYEDVEHLDVSRWNAAGESGGRTDQAAMALVRQLARERLGTFALDEIGAATLSAIDAEDGRG